MRGLGREESTVSMQWDVDSSLRLHYLAMNPVSLTYMRSSIASIT